jgi:hypothetical protein
MEDTLEGAQANFKVEYEKCHEGARLKTMAGHDDSKC